MPFTLFRYGMHMVPFDAHIESMFRHGVHMVSYLVHMISTTFRH